MSDAGGSADAMPSRRTADRMSISFLAPGISTGVMAASDSRTATAYIELTHKVSKSSTRDDSEPPSTVPLRQLTRSGSACGNKPSADLHKQGFTSHDNARDVSPSVPYPNMSEGSSDGCQNDPARAARPPRPSYNEEQKFFIMYQRIIESRAWPDIEELFTEVFPKSPGHRSKGGLTSVYYRIRRSWGLEEVLKTGLDTLESDKRVVHAHAEHFSAASLARIGYLRDQLHDNGV